MYSSPAAESKVDVGYGKLHIGLRAFLQSSLMVEQAEAAVLEPYQQAYGLFG